MAPADMSSSQQRPLRCLVTGFGPFQSETTVNSSYEIARLLDGVYLTKPSTFDTRPALSPNAAKSTDTPVIVSSYLHAVRTSYAEVMRIVPEIHAIPFDIIIHLGLWEGSKVINIERQACKKGHTVFVYCLQVFETSLTYGNSNDIDGRLPALPMGYNRKEDRGFGSGYEYFPEFLREDRINTAAVVKALKARGCEHVAENFDAGNYTCNFIFFASLAEAAKPRPVGLPIPPMVQFIHVPEIGAKPLLGSEFTVANMAEMVKAAIWYIANPTDA